MLKKLTRTFLASHHVSYASILTCFCAWRVSCPINSCVLVTLVPLLSHFSLVPPVSHNRNVLIYHVLVALVFRTLFVLIFFQTALQLLRHATSTKRTSLQWFFVFAYKAQRFAIALILFLFPRLDFYEYRGIWSKKYFIDHRTTNTVQLMP